MNYWVYENTIHKKCRIHRAGCSFCNDGKGIHGGFQTNTGNWFGPYPDQVEAYAAAKKRGQPDVRGCGICVGQVVGNSVRQVDREVFNNTGDETTWPWDLQQEFASSLRFQWIPIGRLEIDAGGKLQFPSAPISPGLYRLRSRSPTGKMAIYIGESYSLKRRFGTYRNPGPTQATSLRINAWLKDMLIRQKNQASVSVATQTAWIIDGDEDAPADFSRKNIRRLFEQFAITADQATDIETLNR